MAILKRQRKAGKARFQVLIDQRDLETGKRHRQVVGTFATKREAETTEANTITERERRTLLKLNTTTASELLEEYLRVEVPRTVRPENRQPYESIIKNHLKPTLGSVQARGLTVEHIAKLLAAMQERNLSSSSMTKTRLHLSSALKLGMHWDIVRSNVAVAAKAPRISYNKATIWTPATVGQFLDTASDDDLWPLWLLRVETGARTSELLGLAWGMPTSTEEPYGSAGKLFAS